jgi:hypothetical protein
MYVKGPAVHYHSLSLSMDNGVYVQQLRVINDCLRSHVSSDSYTIDISNGVVVGIVFSNIVSAMRFELAYMSKGPAVD